METQKRFVISGMFKTLNILGICLILVALFAPTAHAEKIVVDPGAVDGGAQDFAVEATFSEDSPELFVILFTDNKTLEWEAGTHEWLTLGSPSSLAYAGFLLDASGNPIPGTELVGKTQKENDPVPFGVINLSERTVFSGILLTSSGFSDSYVFLDWNWDDNDRPVAGETQASGNQPPLANAGADVTGQVGVPVDFDGSDSSDPDGEIVQYDWNFGDGNSLFDGGPTPSHVYTAPGDYTVYLAVTDNLNAITSALTSASINAGGASLTPTADAVGPYAGDTDTKTTVAAIATNNQLPTADAGGPYAGVVNQPVILDGSASDDPDGNIVQYDWDFDDGNIANNAGATPTNVYATGGKYIARLTVTDDSGETDTDITVVSVGIGNLPPQADAGDSVSGKVRRDITFDGTGSSDPDGSVANYAWSFGDGNTGTGPNPTHSYADVGKYFVTLTVTDNDGATNSDATLVDAEKRSGGGGGGGSCFINTIMGK